MSLVGLFTYCSRCRKIVNLDVAVPCEQTGRHRCQDCADVKVSA